MAAENSGWVNFRIDIREGRHWMPWGAARKFAGRGWVTDEDVPAALKHERITFKPYT
jgi:hypothetical protein